MTMKANDDFIEGAEQLRAMLLDASKGYLAPHIEAVFAVFAKETGFIARKGVLDEILNKKKSFNTL